MKIYELTNHWSPCWAISDHTKIKGHGLCAIKKFLFTYGLITELDESTYKERWCFESLEEAKIALKYWDGNGDPLGLWIKYKGPEREYGNINHPGFNPKFDIPSPHSKVI